MNQDKNKKKRKYVWRNFTPEQKSELSRKIAIEQWKAKKITKHEWHTIRVHKEIWKKLHEEFKTRNGGRTMHGVPNEIKLDWSKFLLELFEDSKTLNKAKKVCAKEQKTAPKKVNLHD